MNPVPKLCLLVPSGDFPGLPLHPDLGDNVQYVGFPTLDGSSRRFIEYPENDVRELSRLITDFQYHWDVLLMVVPLAGEDKKEENERWIQHLCDIRSLSREARRTFEIVVQVCADRETIPETVSGDRPTYLHTNEIRQRFNHAGAYACFSNQDSPALIQTILEDAAEKARDREFIRRFREGVSSAQRVSDAAHIILSGLKSYVDWEKATLNLVLRVPPMRDPWRVEERQAEIEVDRVPASGVPASLASQLYCAPTHSATRRPPLGQPGDVLIRTRLAYQGYAEPLPQPGGRPAADGQKLKKRDMDGPIKLGETIWSTIESRKPLICADTSNRDRPPDWVPEDSVNVNSWICLPLWHSNEPIGFITLDHSEPGRFEDIDAALLERVAPIAAEGIHRTLRRRNTRIIQQVIKEISTQRRIVDLLQIFADTLEKEIGCQGCTFFRRLDEGTQTYLAHWVDERGDLSDKELPPFLSGEGVVGYVCATGQGMMVADSELERYGKIYARLDPLRRHNPRSLLAVPVVVDYRTIAVICLSDSRPNFFSHYDHELVEVLAGQAAALIERTVALEQAVALAQAFNQAKDTRFLLVDILDYARQITNATSGGLFHLVMAEEGCYRLGERNSFPEQPAQAAGRPRRAFGRFERSQNVSPAPKEPDLNDPGSLEARVINSRKIEMDISDRSRVDWQAGGEDASADDHSSGPKASICVPLIFGERLVGLLRLDSNTKEYGFNQMEILSLELLANQAAFAIYHAELLNRTDKLAEASRAVLGELELEKTFAVIAEQVAKLAEAHFCHLARVAGPPGDRRIRFVAAYPPEALSKLKQEHKGIQLDKPGERIGIVGLSVRNEEPLFVPDLELERSKKGSPIQEHYLEYDTKTRAELVVPIKDQAGRVIGVINVEHEKAYGISEENRQSVELFAVQAAIAFEKYKQRERLVRRAKQLSTLGDATHNILLSDPEKLNHTLRATTRLAREAVQADNVALVLMERKETRRLRGPIGALINMAADEEITMLVSTNLPEEKLNIRTDEDSYSRQVFRSGAPKVITNLGADRNANPALKKLGVRSALCLPLVSRDGPIGVIWWHLYRTIPEGFSDEDIKLYELFADEIAQACKSAQYELQARQELDRLRQDITNNMKDNYREVLKQSKQYAIASLIIGLVGMGTVLAAILLDAIGRVDTLVSIPASLAGTLTTLASGLVFRNATKANVRMDRYHNQLVDFHRLDRLLEKASQISPGEGGSDSFSAAVLKTFLATWTKGEVKEEKEEEE